MRAILDTNILIASAGGEPGRPDLAGIESRISSVSVTELAFGLAVCTDRERATRGVRLARILAVYGPGKSYDDVAGASFRLLTEVVVGAGRDPRTGVLARMIAATAHSLGASLVTRDEGMAVYGSVLDVLRR